MPLYLIRHPQPAIAAGVCYGATDLPLAEDPAGLVPRLRALLPAGVPVYSSPLERCRKFAELLHSAPHIDARLREIDFGDWEMRRWDDIERLQLEAWAADPLHFVPPGGEAVADLRARVVAFLAMLPAEAAVIAHAGVMKICAAEMAGETDWFGLRFDYGTVSLIEDGRFVWKNRR